MSQKVYKVAVPGILLKNGRMAKYGEEVRADQIDQPETRHDEGYIKFKSDFDKEAGIAEKEADKAEEEEKEKEPISFKVDDDKKKQEAPKKLI